MKTFSVTQTAFSGYRLLLARPVMTLFWFAFSLAISALTIAVTVQLAGPQLAMLQQIRGQGAAADPATAMTLTRQLGPYYAFTLIFSLVTGAMTLGAASRAVLKPQAGALGFLRLGVDELRLMLVVVVLLVIFFLIYIVTAIMLVMTLVILTGPTGMRALVQGGGLPGSTIAAMCVAAVPGLAALIFLLVKLSLAPAQTVGEGAARIFESWSLIRGRFWRVLGTYLLAAIPVAVVGGVTLVAALAAHGPSAGGFINAMSSMQPDYSSMSTAFAGPNLLVLVLSALGRTLGMAGLMGPAAVIYQAVASDTVGVVDDDDDDDDDDDYDDEG
jgi:hypothetical protein